MNKLLVTLVASAFAFAASSGYAADAVKKKEELTTEQKTEIRDRVERLKSERANTATPATPAPAKKAEPKRTSKAKATPGVTATRPLVKKAPAKV